MKKKLIEPEKLDLRSHDIAEVKRQELLQLFPEIRTEGGKIDFERLKLALGEAVDVGKERYGIRPPFLLVRRVCHHGAVRPNQASAASTQRDEPKSVSLHYVQGRNCTEEYAAPGESSTRLRTRTALP
jgi:hypothetical protein